MEIRNDPEGLERIFVEAPEFEAKFEVHGNCPVQALGTVYDRDLYFRARNDGWSFEVADRLGRLPSDGYRDLDGFYREGGYPQASWMPMKEAIVIIEQCLREYKGELA